LKHYPNAPNLKHKQATRLTLTHHFRQEFVSNKLCKWRGRFDTGVTGVDREPHNVVKTLSIIQQQ